MVTNNSEGFSGMGSNLFGTKFAYQMAPKSVHMYSFARGHMYPREKA